MTKIINIIKKETQSFDSSSSMASQQQESGEASWRPSAAATVATTTLGLALCSNACGFFGSPQTDNLCSLCYKTTLANTAHTPPSLAPGDDDDDDDDDDGAETPGIMMAPPARQDASKSGDGAPTCMEVRSVGASKSGDGAPTQRIEVVKSLSASNSHTCIEVKSLGASKSRNDTPTLIIEVKSRDNTTTTTTTAAAAAATTQVDTKIMPTLKLDVGGGGGDRCHICRKRLGLGCRFKCRCGSDRYGYYVFFCSSHRFPDQHNCTFDYKSVGREAISKDNPLVKADKLQHRI